MEIYFTFLISSIVKRNFTTKVFLLCSVSGLIFIQTHNFNRFHDHLIKLVDAIHILTSIRISGSSLNKANILLMSFVEHFEVLYGRKNMVYNVHQLVHLTECVKMNGPLSVYSNYTMEDNIGHLVSFVKGTTDVTSQICSRYLLEKHLYISLQKSPLALSYHEQIESKLSFAVSENVDGSLLIGKPNYIRNLNDHDKTIIRNELNIGEDVCIVEYGSILLKSRVFYETLCNSRKKRTSDSFVYNTELNQFGIIKSIFTVNEKIYFFVSEELKVGEKTASNFITFLDQIIQRSIIFKTEEVTKKYILIRFDNILAMAHFPNHYEKN